MLLIYIKLKVCATFNYYYQNKFKKPDAPTIENIKAKLMFFISLNMKTSEVCIHLLKMFTIYLQNKCEKHEIIIT